MPDEIQNESREVTSNPSKRKKGAGLLSTPGAKVGVTLLVIFAVAVVVRWRIMSNRKMLDDLKNEITQKQVANDSTKNTQNQPAAVVPMAATETTIVAAGAQPLRIDRITAIDMKGENIKVSPVVAVPFRQYVKYTGGDGKWVYLNTVYPGSQRPHDTIDSKIQTMGYQLVAGYGLTETKLAYCLYVGKPPEDHYWYQTALYKAGLLSSIAQQSQ